MRRSLTATSALELDRSNWRTYNNRAAVFVGLKKFDLAMTDVNAGLEIAPNSATLRKSREVVTAAPQRRSCANAGASRTKPDGATRTGSGRGSVAVQRCWEPAASCRSSSRSSSAPSTTTCSAMRWWCPSPSARPSPADDAGDPGERGAGPVHPAVLPVLRAGRPARRQVREEPADPPDAPRRSGADVLRGASRCTSATSRCCSRVIFLLGVLATIFGPLKYSLMPQHLRQSELVGGNALVDAGTFLAILVGTIAAACSRRRRTPRPPRQRRRCASRGRRHDGRGGRRHVPVLALHSARRSHRSRRSRSTSIRSPRPGK